MKRVMRSKRMMRKELSTWMINTDVVRCRLSIRRIKSLRVKMTKLLFSNNSINSS